ncbi:unnamed protein product [Spirodela intermedia]|uniref:Uncharacterized protein n=1 Tax=Spirodela intermedia TaxID=51605 RepID=A0A7I8L7Z9_SPIIN|nr:unnamed protein product [Spirodela intermedia]
MRRIRALPISSCRRLTPSTFSGDLQGSRHRLLFPPHRSQSSSPPFHRVSGGRGFDGEEEEQDDDDEEEEELVGGGTPSPEELAGEVEAVLSSLEGFESDGTAARNRLEQSGAAASPELVREVLSRLRHRWAAAFTFFLWAANQPGYAHSLREYHSMVAILGKMRRFDTAWSLIEEMRSSSLVTPQTLLILLRRYAATRDVARSISTFYAMKKFGFSPGIEDFHGLLSALCRYKNVADAEHLLFCNEAAFSPLPTKSFNIVLNGWCNAVGNLREAKRFWREMGRRGVQPDAISYGAMISCYSKASNLRDVLKVFDSMKDLGIEPDRKVYNAVVYALAKGGRMREARRLVKAMEEEKGIAPNAATFNSLIRPLCKARRAGEAREMFEEMRSRGLSPCVRTFHAMFDTVKTSDEVFEMLELMKQAKCPPANETYIMLIRKLCRWRRHESVAKLWTEMAAAGGGPDRSAYVVLIHGLFLNGKLAEAAEFYEEMKVRGFSPEPRTEEMMQAFFSGRDSGNPPGGGGAAAAVPPPADQRETGGRSSPRCRNSLSKPEERSVTRERGFSLWN